MAGMTSASVFVRSTLFMLAALCITPPYALLAWVVWPLPARVRYRIVTSWSHIMIAMARAICGIRYRIVGQPPQGGPYIVLSKHQSAWETLAFQVLFPPQVLVLKRWLLWLPFFGWGLATLSPITVTPGAGTRTLRRMLVQGRDRLEQGFWVVVFPEGTRVRPGERGTYQAGGAWLACKTNVPVVPVAHDAGRLWPKNSFLKYPGVVTVRIGTPIEPDGLSTEELNRRVADWIELQMSTLAAREA